MAEEQFDFDELIARRGTRSLKWDIDQDPDVIELWVADMDFRAAPVILEALQKKLDSGVFGYGLPTKAFYEAIVSWLPEALRSGILADFDYSHDRCGARDFLDPPGALPPGR